MAEAIEEVGVETFYKAPYDIRLTTPQDSEYSRIDLSLVFDRGPWYRNLTNSPNSIFVIPGDQEPDGVDLVGLVVLHVLCGNRDTKSLIEKISESSSDSCAIP